MLSYRALLPQHPRVSSSTAAAAPTGPPPPSCPHAWLLPTHASSAADPYPHSPSSPPTKKLSPKFGLPVVGAVLLGHLLLRTADGMSNLPAICSSTASPLQNPAILVASITNISPSQPMVISHDKHVTDSDMRHYVIMTWRSILHIITILREPITAVTHINVTKLFRRRPIRTCHQRIPPSPWNSLGHYK